MHRVPLLPVAQLSALDDELIRRARELDLAIDVTDGPAGLARARALLFERWPELLPAPLDPPMRFYNHYFWFLRFATLWQAAHGEDPGLEQQAFQILEQVDFEIDGDVFQQVERLARSQTDSHP